MARRSRGVLLGGVWVRCITWWRARKLLLEIADRLWSCEPVGIRGVAIASQLIEERRGPLYRDNADRPLTVTAFEALVALDRGLRTISVSDE